MKSLVSTLMHITMSLVLAFSSVAFGDESRIGTQATAVHEPSKGVVFDVSVEFHVPFKRLLESVMQLGEQHASDPDKGTIVLVLRGPEIRFFVARHYNRYKSLVDQALALAANGFVQFRVCREAADSRYLSERDFYDFVRVVPSGAEEIEKLRREGYVYVSWPNRSAAY